MSEAIFKDGTTKPPRRPEAPETMSEAPDWNDMETAPQDGSTIIVTPDGAQEIKAYWRRTRTRKIGHGWERIAYWATPISMAKIDVQLLGWKPIPPFAVVFDKPKAA